MIGRRLPASLLSVVVAATIVAACGESGGTVGSSVGSVEAAPSSPVEGVVIDVESAGLGEVGSFTIRTADGQQVTILMGDLENAAEFPPAHIGEHLASGEPVRVTFTMGADGPVAVRIEDAG
jgi:hypothetical protein